MNLREALSEYFSLSGDSKLISAASLMTNFGSNMGGFLTVFYVLSLGYGLVFFGLLNTVGAISYVVLLLPASSLSYAIGSRKSLMLSAGLQGTAGALLSISTTRGAFIASSVLGSMGMAISTANMGPLISKAERIERRTHAFSLNYFMYTMGGFAGTALSGTSLDLLRPFLGDIGSYRAVYALSSAAALASLFFIKRIGVDIRSRIPLLKPNEQNSRTIAKMMTASSLIGAGAGFLIPYFSIQFKYRFSISIAAISVIFSLTNLFMAFMALLMPRIEGIRGSLRTIVGSWVAATTVMVLMPFVGALDGLSFPLFSAFYLIRTTLMNAISPVQSSFEMSMLDEQYRSIGASLENLAWNLTYAVTVTLGAVLMKISLNYPFYACAAFYYSSAVLYYLFFRSRGEAGQRQLR
ncbi:MAG: MFS transporter [Nitrososphaeria archaeon]